MDWPRPLFRDRHHAGRQLGQQLEPFRDDDPVILALPRGGVPVGREVADMLDAPLDVILVRKLGVPGQPELAMGAIGEGDVIVENRTVIDAAGINDEDWDTVIAAERVELVRRAGTYRPNRDRIEIAGRTVIVVDDGIATGSTARAAGQVARAAGARSVVLAAPVAPYEAIEDLLADFDRVETLAIPDPFRAIGFFYADFSQTTDEEVLLALER
jgi:putative phosphoribosyl transferase